MSTSASRAGVAQLGHRRRPARCRTAGPPGACSKARLRALGPAQRQLHRALDLGVARAGSRTHSSSCICDVGAEQALDLDGALRRQLDARRRRYATEGHAFSSSLRSFASDITWKPPESVRIGSGQFMKRVQAAERAPPARRRAAASGDRCCRARCRRRRRAPAPGYIAFTSPAVPTGMKAGVRITPRGVDQPPGARRAVRCASSEREVRIRATVS